MLRIRKPATGVVAPALLCLVLGAAGGVGTALVTEPSREPELVRFTVPRQPPPDFRLRDEHGVWRSPANARGDVLVVEFIFTRCRDLCPAQSREVRDAVLAAGGGVQAYAITVDPENDTPQDAQRWLKRIGIGDGPMHVLLGTRRELTPIWERFGIVPIAREPRAEDPGEYEEYGPPQLRPPPTAAHDAYPATGDGTYRGRPRHAGGLDYEHSAYVLLIDERGRERVGFPYEQVTSDLLLRDIRALKAES
jgi:protein SCO1